ncbi:MAG TPA: hypothetical protein VH538_13195 [Gaiellaceae bacterium]
MKGQLGSWRAWWRERVPFEQKAAVVVLFLGGVLVAGWLAADSLSSASASVTKASSSLVETVDRVVTVREPGKNVTTRVPVVKIVHVAAKGPAAKTRTVDRTSTVFATSTVRLPEYVTHVVTAPPRTVTDTVTEVRTTTVTKAQWRVVTVVEKSPPVTVTVTAPAP